MTTALEGGEWSAARPGRSLRPGKSRYPLYRRLGGPQGRSGQVRKISPPTGIRSPDRRAHSLSLYLLCYPAHDVSVLVQNWKDQQRVLNTDMREDTGRRTTGCVIILACNSGLIEARSIAAHKLGICVRACAPVFRFLCIAFVSFVHTIYPFVLSLPLVISLLILFICAFIFLFTFFLVPL